MIILGDKKVMSKFEIYFGSIILFDILNNHLGDMEAKSLCIVKTTQKQVQKLIEAIRDNYYVYIFH